MSCVSTRGRVSGHILKLRMQSRVLQTRPCCKPPVQPQLKLMYMSADSGQHIRMSLRMHCEAICSCFRYMHSRGNAFAEQPSTSQQNDHSDDSSFTIFTVLAVSTKSSLSSSVVPVQLMMWPSSCEWFSCSCFCNFLKLPFCFGFACK